MKTEGDVKSDNSIAKVWRLCTVQEVEDLKNVIRVLPLWSSAILRSTPIAVLSSMSVLPALTMDRHLGLRFVVPAGSVLVLMMISASISLVVIDHFCFRFPSWQKLTGSSPTVLHRIGVGHIVNVLAMVVSALVESFRLHTAHSHHLQNVKNSVVPMSVMGLFTQLILVGIGEAFHFLGQVSLYYQEFPENLRNSSTAMVAAVIGIAFYSSTAIVHLVRRSTGWLPEDLNNGHLDYLYWLLAGLGTAKFGYYLVCARLYKGNGESYRPNLPMTDDAEGHKSRLECVCCDAI